MVEEKLCGIRGVSNPMQVVHFISRISYCLLVLIIGGLIEFNPFTRTYF